MTDTSASAAELLVRCLENEEVRVVFGIPGEENIRTTTALARSSIRYVLTRHEQAASFMAEMYARVTGEAGVVTATLGPGAINMQLGVADATTNSTPLVAISAQVGHARSFKESHQSVDLVSMFVPITRWAASVPSAAALPEMVRKAFKLAQTERPGAVYLAVPEDVDEAGVEAALRPLPRDVVVAEAPSAVQIDRAADVLRAARRPVVVAGHGVARGHAGPALARFAEALDVAVTTTFHGKGVLADDHPNAAGTIGFMARDHVDAGLDDADLIIAVGYEFQELDPVRINPRGDKQIVHVHRLPAEVDAHYPVEVGVEGGIATSLDALAAATGSRPGRRGGISSAQRLRDELDRGRADDRFPLAPRRVVADTRDALGRDDVVLVDTGAVKMWMGRLYPTYAPNTCLISNGLSTMGFALPGALGVKLARPASKVLAVMGDGAFLMNSQEIETATRERIPLVVLVWNDSGYGLIEWKMELETGTHDNVAFANPDIEMYAASFGATGHRIEAAHQLLPTLRKALAGDGVSIIDCPVDYRDNLELTSDPTTR